MRTTHVETRAPGFAVVMAAVCVWAAAPAARAQTYTVLHSFGSSEGSPRAELIQASDGYLYGSTESGGATGLGTVYRIDTSGNFTTLHSFGGADGASPEASLIQATDGYLYGTTQLGGDSGAGTVFRVDTEGNLTTLHSFSQEDGAAPIAGLVEGGDGFLYGTTSQGGTSANCPGGCGTIFRIDTAGNLTSLYSFEDGDDGAIPPACLIQTSDSNLYGTTQGDFDWTIGSVYRIDPSGNLTVLHTFDGFTGSEPRSGVVDGGDGYFYGTTAYGPYPDEGGSVYRIGPSGSFTTLHHFQTAEGTHPYARLIHAENGYLYGTTTDGGSSGGGTIFRIDESGSLAMVHTFSRSGGSRPTKGLIQASDGNLYGTTDQGGASELGVVYRFEDCVVSPVITPSGSTDFCEGGSVTLDAGAGYAAYLWSTGETTQTILVTASGAFTVTVTSAAGCQGTSPEVDVVVVPNPKPVITAPACVPPNAAGLTASVPYVQGDNYIWTITGGTITGGQGTRQVHFSSGDPGTEVSLSVTETRSPGCVGAATANVQVQPAPAITVTRCLPPNTPGFEASTPFTAGHTYNWTISGGTIDSGQGTDVIGFTTAGAGTRISLSVDETTELGCVGTGLETMQVDFSDVPAENPFHSAVCVIGRDGITVGHPDGSYGVDDAMTRAQMAVLLIKAQNGPGFVPPHCTGIFADVACSPNPAFAADWIEWLYVSGVTAGCAAGPELRYCPDQPISRAQMAVLLLRAAHGTGFTPPPCTGIFQDVPCSPVPAFAADWIEELYNEGVTAGCQTDPLSFCPGAPVKRGPMAAFLVAGFGLE